MIVPNQSEQLRHSGRRSGIPRKRLTGDISGGPIPVQKTFLDPNLVNPHLPPGPDGAVPPTMHYDPSRK